MSLTAKHGYQLWKDHESAADGSQVWNVHSPASNAFPVPLFTVLPEDLPKLGFRPGVQDLLCTHLCTRAHAHIQGGVLREAESSVPLVNL